MLILNLQEAFFREREIANKVQANEDIAVDSEFESEIKELLEIIPQKRKRIDSYNKLVRYLKSSFGVDLIISSKKTKNVNL